MRHCNYFAQSLQLKVYLVQKLPKSRLSRLVEVMVVGTDCPQPTSGLNTTRYEGGRTE